ncbi:hypothetical protein CROQUDRAFT_654544 [Cronartium quercuum f. sp. fusiforme G11]|uniref:Major facilitator superfamily (MFS) profile domain-containing protein n=1 Tax=Cronartium quercuum f. sp. fusiforme G11 TaxID=708437 RepID=A0A9P6NSF1_9BASI|nr:hypothetical protein CROQUDRAFT_654544 [Cronartium quercuum f. sp. fusiforme G11]
MGNQSNVDYYSSQSDNTTDAYTTKKLEGPQTISELNLCYTRGQGKLVIDPLEAEAEFGKELAQKLKLDKSGTVVLWPQPDDSPDDPQNWSPRQKMIILVILTMAAFVPDSTSAVGIAALFNLANEYNTTPGVVNDVSSNWSIFLLGPGGIVAVLFARRYGRLPILFWSQVIGLAFLIGCAVAPTLPVFAAMRCLSSFFATAPQVMGLYVVNDLYPFHEQARMLNLWTCGYIISPFVSPWLFGYLTASIYYRWAYWIAIIYMSIVVVLIAVFMEETIYDRFSTVKSGRSQGFHARFKSLIGVTGFHTAKYRESWGEVVWSIVQLLGKPHLLAVLLYLGIIFGFAIGINVTNPVFVLSAPPLGYGLSAYASASLYATPVVAVILGEVLGRYLNDFLANRLTRRNKGIFEPEMRLWTLYVGLPPFIVGFVLLGAAFEKKLHLAILVLGWGLAQIAVMISTVACYNYANNAFAFPGEISALLNQARILGGFAIPYFQVEWASSRGALQTFGCEAAIVAGLFILVVPVLQLKGKTLRAKFASTPSSLPDIQTPK